MRCGKLKKFNSIILCAFWETLWWFCYMRKLLMGITLEQDYLILNNQMNHLYNSPVLHTLYIFIFKLIEIDDYFHF